MVCFKLICLKHLYPCLIMNKKIFIASIVVSTALLGGCKKDEFEDSFTQPASEMTEAKASDNGTFQSVTDNGISDGGMAKVKFTGTEETFGTTGLKGTGGKGGSDKPVATIKETSDGDDEADSGDAALIDN